jgi:RNA polymerase sigma factor (sigma-70 family)
MAAPPADAQLEDLVRRFSRLVRSVAARVGGTDGRRLADDVEQEVFLSLWKQLQREQVIEHPSSYLYRSAVRETIRLLNRDRREEAADDDAALAVQDQAPTPADRLASVETGEKLVDAIQSLPIDRRRAVRAYLAGFSVPEVMKMYGWSYERARNLSTRGMSDLRAQLRTRGIDG